MFLLVSMATKSSAPLIGPIQFRNLIAQLNSTEITTFINNINPEIFIDALSCYFIHGARVSNEERMKRNDICNDVVSSIIESRDHQPADPMVFQLDALPCGLIGACGSYLDQMSYARLSTTNRDIYLASNTPGTLKEVTVPYLSPAVYNILNCSTISNAQTLSFELYHGNDKESGMSADGMHIIASQIAKMSRLHSLELCELNSKFIGIIANHEATNQRINSLTVYHEGARGRFISSIAAFKHIQYLRVHGLWQDPHSADNSKIKQLIEMCGDLRALDCFDDEDHEGSTVEISLLQAVGHRLHYLSINILHNDQIVALENIHFANLRELQDGYGTLRSVPAVQAILDSAINLEKVRLENKLALIVKTLTKCKRLRYLEVHRVEDMEGTLNALEHGLFQTKALRRDKLKIRISLLPYPLASVYSVTPISNHLECVIKLDRIVNSLSVNKTDQWMIILDISGDHENFVESLLGSLTADIATTHVFQNKFRLHDMWLEGIIVLVTNPGCTICGWWESWLMGSE